MKRWLFAVFFLSTAVYAGYRALTAFLVADWAKMLVLGGFAACSLLAMVVSFMAIGQTHPRALVDEADEEEPDDEEEEAEAPETVASDQPSAPIA